MIGLGGSQGIRGWSLKHMTVSKMIHIIGERYEKVYNKIQNSFAFGSFREGHENNVHCQGHPKYGKEEGRVINFCTLL